MADLPLGKVTGKIFSSSRLSGGDISDVVHLKAEKGDFVLKTNRRAPAGLFRSEALGLSALAAAGLKVPQIYLVSEDFLLMEFFSRGAAKPREAGEALAALHNRRQTHYGFSEPTYLATLLQDNERQGNWADFYREKRLRPLLRVLAEESTGERIKWDAFLDKMRSLLDSCERPSLLHGDLWAGNLFYAQTAPVFIDPAVYCGDPLVDIAMTRLFGGFGPEFYDAYAANMPGREGEDELIKIYQIYPLLVHSRLFDRRPAPASGSYYSAARAIREAFI